MNKKILMLLVILGSVWLLLTLTGCTAVNESEAFYFGFKNKKSFKNLS